MPYTMNSVRDFIGVDGELKIVNSIKEAEINTSGEIRVHIESKCGDNPVDRALYLFHFLKMDKTVMRNGVLFYVAVKSRRFAVIGDKGINDAVPDDFWDSIKLQLESDFKAENYINGLAIAISKAGQSLKEYFPYKSDDVNEQPDEISYGQ